MGVRARVGDESKQLSVIMVEGKGPDLLGRDWLSELRVDWKQVHRIGNPLEEVISRYPTVFSEGLGTYAGEAAHIQVADAARPRFCKARAVPYALKDLVNEQLEKMEAEGVISAVKFAEWAAPIVPVLKDGGARVRICGDYKQTVNQAARIEQYALPRIEDLFAELAGGVTFSKLDLSQAYSQIPLDKESRKLTTINTLKGLYEFNRLPFGISSAPAIFQRIMDGLLKGIPGVCTYLDDILITGRNQEEHAVHLEEVLKWLSQAGLRLRRDQCVFNASSVVYLGHRIDCEGLHPTGEKIEALKHAPRPRDRSELEFFRTPQLLWQVPSQAVHDTGAIARVAEKTPILEVDNTTGTSLSGGQDCSD